MMMWRHCPWLAWRQKTREYTTHVFRVLIWTLLGSYAEILMVCISNSDVTSSLICDMLKFWYANFVSVWHILTWRTCHIGSCQDAFIINQLKTPMISALNTLHCLLFGALSKTSAWLLVCSTRQATEPTKEGAHLSKLRLKTMKTSGDFQPSWAA